MTGLFLKEIANSLGGTVSFSLPTCDGTGNFVIVDGFLSEHPTVTMKNKWDNILPDLDALNDYSQLATGSMTSWLASSKASWKGTDPINLSLSFYLITYKLAQVTGSGTGRDLPISKQAAYFAQLAAVSAEAGKLISVGVHGGYRPNVFERNENFGGLGSTENSGGPVSIIDQMLKATGYVGSHDIENGNNGKGGTIQIVINGGGKPSMVFTKMLLSDITFNPSTVRAGYWSGNEFIKSNEPLYIKIDATFRLMHTATVQDAVRMFTGRSSL